MGQPWSPKSNTHFKLLKQDNDKPMNSNSHFSPNSPLLVGLHQLITTPMAHIPTSSTKTQRAWNCPNPLNLPNSANGAARERLQTLILRCNLSCHKLSQAEIQHWINYLARQSRRDYARSKVYWTSINLIPRNPQNQLLVRCNRMEC